MTNAYIISLLGCVFLGGIFTYIILRLKNKPLYDMNSNLQKELSNTKIELQNSQQNLQHLNINYETYKASNQSNLQNLQENLQKSEQRCLVLETRIETLNTDNKNLLIQLEQIETAKKLNEQAYQDKLVTLESVKAGIEKDLQLFIASMSEHHQKNFMHGAKAIFEDQSRLNLNNINNIVNPMQEALKQYQEKLDIMEKERKSDEGSLVGFLKEMKNDTLHLRDSTNNLVGILKNSSKTRGKWGEQQLKNVLEMAGMLEHVDFETEKSFNNTDDTRMRPDVIIRMPGNRRLVVDAKTSLSAYIDAMHASSDDVRNFELKKHAAQLRNHAMELASKKYWTLMEETPDFVIMFVPGEQYYAAAIENDPNIFEDAYEKNIIIATPTTFLALAKAIAYGWRQEKVSQEAKKIHSLATELYKRLQTMGQKIQDVTKAMQSVVKKHNEFIGSLETNVMPQARKLHELGVGSGYGEVEHLNYTESEVRDIRTDRDFAVA